MYTYMYVVCDLHSVNDDWGRLLRLAMHIFKNSSGTLRWLTSLWRNLMYDQRRVHVRSTCMYSFMWSTPLQMIWRVRHTCSCDIEAIVSLTCPGRYLNLHYDIFVTQFAHILHDIDIHVCSKYWAVYMLERRQLLVDQASVLNFRIHVYSTGPY